MKKVKLIIGITAWTVFLAIIIASFASSCSKDEPIAERPSEDGLLLNDDLIAIKEDDGNITIKNTVTSVTATKGYGASSIGAGKDGTCGTVTIEEGANVTQN